MSVPTWKRHPNGKADYIYNIFTFNVKIGLMVNNGSKKYLNTYGKDIINMGIEAYKYANIANSTRITDKENYIFRRENLKKAEGIIDSMGTICSIYLSILKNDDNLSPKKREKISKWELEVGKTINKILSQIKNVEKYDRDFYMKLSCA